MICPSDQIDARRLWDRSSSIVVPDCTQWAKHAVMSEWGEEKAKPAELHNPQRTPSL